jgi:hypothetical protein
LLSARSRRALQLVTCRGRSHAIQLLGVDCADSSYRAQPSQLHRMAAASSARINPSRTRSASARAGNIFCLNRARRTQVLNICTSCVLARTTRHLRCQLTAELAPALSGVCTPAGATSKGLSRSAKPTETRRRAAGTHRVPIVLCAVRPQPRYLGPNPASLSSPSELRPLSNEQRAAHRLTTRWCGCSDPSYTGRCPAALYAIK